MERSDRILSPTAENKPVSEYKYKFIINERDI